MRRILIVLVCSLLCSGLAFAESNFSSIEGLTKREVIKLTRAAKKKNKKAKKNKKKKNKNKNKEKNKNKDKIPGLEAVCSKVSNLNGLLVKITAGGHIGRNDARYSGWSIICAGRCVKFPAVAYHCDGSQAFKMGYYGRWSGNGKARGYCAAGGARACSVSATRRANKKKSCGGAVYLKTGGKSCMRFNINSNRNGGV